ncbi:MAG: 3-hydroxyacyl-CoA dehydrogenase/enoyl-CoA hydratase family protein [Calditrichia bacterium]
MKSMPQKAAVLGAGIMGSQIAAHFANIGLPVLLYDVDQESAVNGLNSLQKMKPAPFYSPRYSARITPLNYRQHLSRLQEADFIIEAIVERLEIKQNLYHQILPHLMPAAIISSNTSGLSVKELTEGMPREFRRRFLVTHFFNPPRYMHLLEIIPGEDTLPEIVKAAVNLAENFLGKGVVYGKDTPNFIANRIGVYHVMLAIKLAVELHLSVEEVDQLTGPVIGHPKSATFRTADLVGLDTLAHVANTAWENCREDESRELFKIPAVLQKLLKEQRTGAKSGAGFYKKTGKEILALNFDTLQYRPKKKVRLDGVRVAKRRWNTASKIQALIESNDAAGRFTWKLLANTLLYSARRIPEISDNIINIDNALKWGFGWQLGPFETWEALGLQKTVQQMEAEHMDIPEWVKQMAAAGINRFYRYQNAGFQYYDPVSQDYRPVRENPKVMRLPVYRNRGKELLKNWNASLIDLGEGVALAEFHSIVQPDYNPLDGAIVNLLAEAVETLPAKGFRALVIGHQGTHFSSGANLALLLKYSEEKNWQILESLSRTFQETTQLLHYSPIPVIAAPFKMCLGGGFEIIGACAKRVAAAELYCGLVEVGVGIIPAAGGNLRLLMNNFKSMEKSRPGPFPVVQKTFETIGFAKVSGSAKEAVFLGYLTADDLIVINPDHLLYEAAKTARQQAEGYTPPAPCTHIILPGKGGRLAIEITLENLRKAGTISDHDLKIGRKLARVLTGGDQASPHQPVNEQYLLDLEREAFVSLCGEPLSQQRMAHMLKTGKPLRN